MKGKHYLHLTVLPADGVRAWPTDDSREVEQIKLQLLKVKHLLFLRIGFNKSESKVTEFISPAYHLCLCFLHFCRLDSKRSLKKKPIKRSWCHETTH